MKVEPDHEKSVYGIISILRAVGKDMKIVFQLGDENRNREY